MGGENGRDMPGHVPLGALLTGIDAGKSPLAEDTPAGDGEWGVLKVSAVQPGRFVSGENKVIRRAGLIHERFEVKPGDLIITRANTEELVGFACVAQVLPPRLLLSDKTLRLRVDSTVADPKFVELALNRPLVRQRIRAMATGTSAGMKNLSQEQIQQLPIPGLPLDEQRRIVAAHAAFERRIAGLERMRMKLRSAECVMSEALMSRAASSRCLLLDELLVRIETGWSPACDSRPPAGDEWGVIKVSAITSGRFAPHESKRLPAELAPRPRIEIREGDVLVARANGARALVGAVCRVGPTRRKLMLSDKVLRLVPDPGQAESAFLPILLRSHGVRRQIGNLLNGGTGQNNISQSDVRALEIPHIALEEQQQIIAVQAAWQHRYDASGRQIDKLRKVQQAVVEDLLSGGRNLAQVPA